MLNATTDSIPNDLSVLKYIPDILSHKIILLLLENSVYFTSRWIIFYLSLIIRALIIDMYSDKHFYEQLLNNSSISSNKTIIRNSKDCMNPKKDLIFGAKNEIEK